MKIKAEIEVFDDLMYCNKTASNRCSYLFRGQCEHFFINLEHEFPKPGKDDEYEKCDECKAAYQSAKNQDETARREFEEFWRKIATTHTEEDKALCRVFWSKSRGVVI